MKKLITIVSVLLICVTAICAFVACKEQEPDLTGLNAAKEYLETMLKDAATVIARKDGNLFINPSGSPAMAKGGSGDVLCGVIAGLLGLGMDECEAASLGVYIHGLAGEAAARKFGMHSVLAGELADCVGEVINETV